MLLVDRLPAGFEIDNPKLVDSDAVAALAWLETDVEPAHTEFRDDRFVAAFDRAARTSRRSSPSPTWCAPSRPGATSIPPATVEDMYRPERFGRTAFGTVEVRAGAAVSASHAETAAVAARVAGSRLIARRAAS